MGEMRAAPISEARRIGKAVGAKGVAIIVLGGETADGETIFGATTWGSTRQHCDAIKRWMDEVEPFLFPYGPPELK